MGREPAGTAVRRRLRSAVLLALGAALALLMAVPAHAGQTRLFEATFCEPTGLGAAPCEPSFGRPYSISVHQPSGEVIVLDSTAKTIHRFQENGEPAPFSALGTSVIDGKKGPGGKPCAEEPASCDETPEGGFTVAGSFSQEAQIAVDSSGGPTDGNIYLTQKNASGLHLVDVFDSTGSFRGQLTGTAAGPFGPASRPAGVAVDVAGNVYVSDFGEDKIYKYVPSAQPPVNADGSLFSGAVDNPGRIAAGVGPSGGALFVSVRFSSTHKLGSDGAIQCQVHDGEAIAVAVSPTTGNLLVSDQKSGQNEIVEYDASSCSENTEATPIARFASARRDVAVEEPGGRAYLTAASQLELYGPLVPLANPLTEAATDIGETSATVNGRVEALGEELTECRFEYGTTTAYGSSIPCAESLAEIGTGTASVHADLSGLAPDTAYHFRLVTANANGPSDPQGEDRSFHTVGKPDLLGSWPSDVAITEATLKARINPQSAETTYRFQWGPDSGPPYEHTSAEVSIGSEPVPQTVSLLLRGLEPDSSYHFRVIASNHCRPESDPEAVCTTVGEERTVTTYRPFAAQTDCPNQDRRGGASAFLPDCRAYELVSLVDKNGSDVYVTPGGYTQAAPGGARISYSVGGCFGDQPTCFSINQYLSSRGGGGWSTEGIQIPTTGRKCCPAVFFGLPRHIGAFTPDVCDVWQVDYQSPPVAADAQAGFPNLYRRHNCGAGAGELETLTTAPPPPGSPEVYLSADSLQGVSDDGRHALFTAEAPLTADAAAGFNKQLYDRFGGELHLVSVLPGGEANPETSFVGSGSSKSLHNAVAADGSRVYWTSTLGSDVGAGKIYQRRHPGQGVVAGECEAGRACTTPVSAGSSAFFWAASEDGTEAIYTEGGLLSEFREGEPTRLIAADVEGVVGAAEDLSRIYFVSTAALAGGATAGEPNLYLDQEGATSFIATLSPGDVEGAAPYDLTGENHGSRSSRVSPDGSHLAFQSRASLTGFDNTDQASGKAAVEVFLYEAGGELLCVSCNPSGARPRTRGLSTFPYNPRFRSDVPAAAWIPGLQRSLHASNLLSADGKRLFFNANDALLPRDRNGAQDVYQWQAAGSGSCSEDSPSYFKSNGGCLDLISSGQSPFESEFWEASRDGRDVFFTTESSLLSQDPGLIDLYDARAGGGFPRPVERAACEGEACQSPPPPPRFDAPPTTTAGPPNPRSRRHCGRLGRRAMKLSRRARRLRGNARRVASSVKSRRLRRKSRRLARRARGTSAKAKRCRRANRRRARR